MHNDGELLKEKLEFRMRGTIENYESLLENAEKEILICEKKIKALIKSNQKESLSIFAYNFH